MGTSQPQHLGSWSVLGLTAPWTPAIRFSCSWCAQDTHRETLSLRCSAGEIIFETACQVLIKLAIKQARSSVPCGCRDDKTKDQFLWWCKWLQLCCLQQGCTFPCWAAEPALSSLRQDWDINSNGLHSAGKKPWCREAKNDTLQWRLRQHRDLQHPSSMSASSLKLLVDFFARDSWAKR